MTRLFEQRERAAEMIHAEAEMQDFLQRRRGLDALAAFASHTLDQDAPTAERYATDLVTAMVGGASDDRLIETVRADLKAGGHETARSALGAIFSRVATQPGRSI